MLSKRKLLAVLLAFAMALALLAGCAKDQEKAGTISDFESQAHIGVSDTGDTSKAPPTGDFVVSEKKYDYNDANLVLLYVENQTNRHYNVTIKGKYLDENGEVIQEETQTFEGFPSGWANNFIFYPRKAFDSFTYTVDTVEYVPDPMTCDETGTPYASYIEFTYEKELEWIRFLSMEIDPDERHETRALIFNGDLINRHPTTTISSEFHLLILDANGEIYKTNYDYRDSINWPDVDFYVADPVGMEQGHSQVVLKEQERDDDKTIPDTVQGAFTAIFAVTSAIDYTLFREGITIPDDISIEYIY